MNDKLPISQKDLSPSYYFHSNKDKEFVERIVGCGGRIYYDKLEKAFRFIDGDGIVAYARKFGK